jgi:hypothetical protein
VQTSKLKYEKLNFKVKVRKMILSALSQHASPSISRGFKANDHALKGFCTFATNQKHKNDLTS